MLNDAPRVRARAYSWGDDSLGLEIAIEQARRPRLMDESFAFAGAETMHREDTK